MFFVVGFLLFIVGEEEGGGRFAEAAKAVIFERYFVHISCMKRLERINE